MSQAAPTKIQWQKGSRALLLEWPDGIAHSLGFELLRVYSPSAEVQGHGPGQAVLQTGKKNVNITAINTVGRYAVQLVFDDGHDSGIYSWSFLRRLGEEQEQYWADYLQALHDAGANRDPEIQVVQIQDPG